MSSPLLSSTYYLLATHPAFVSYLLQAFFLYLTLYILVCQPSSLPINFKSSSLPVTSFSPY